MPSCSLGQGFILGFLPGSIHCSRLLGTCRYLPIRSLRPRWVALRFHVPTAPKTQDPLFSSEPAAFWALHLRWPTRKSRVKRWQAFGDPDMLQRKRLMSTRFRKPLSLAIERVQDKHWTLDRCKELCALSETLTCGEALKFHYSELDLSSSSSSL